MARVPAGLYMNFSGGSRGSSLGSDEPPFPDPKARYVTTYSRKPALSAAESTQHFTSASS